MLLSMTGFGEARHEDGGLSVTAEVRSVNNRHFKLMCRISAPHDALEPNVERLVRGAARRGTVHVSLRVDRPRRAEDYRLNLVALQSYREQLQAASGRDEPRVPLAALLSLPGVVEDHRDDDAHPHDDWPIIESVLSEALAHFRESRMREGRAMAEELLALGRGLADQLERIAARVPEVVAGLNQRLLERVQALVGSATVVEPKDVIREVAILAERGDIAEEITRLRAHIHHYFEVIQGQESAGRKLEFVVQEMGRETNTIGSKANDFEISRGVVEMKGILERIRELIQNVE